MNDHYSPCAIVFSADADPGYGRGLAVALYSTLRELSPDLSAGVYVLDCGIGEKERERLVRVAHRARPGTVLNWILVAQHRLAPLPSAPRFPPVVYSRLLIPELLPEYIERAIFMDADLLVRKDIADLFSVDLGDALVGGVPDFGVPLPADGGRPYFNAGVLVLNLAVWRRDGIPGRLVDFVSTHPRLEFQDQDALNAVIDRWRELDYSWNLQLGAFAPKAPVGWMPPDRLEALRRQLGSGNFVIHFTGAKPWKPSQESLLCVDWLRYSLRSGWDTSAGEALPWLLRWALDKTRLLVGTQRLRVAGRIAPPRPAPPLPGE